MPTFLGIIIANILLNNKGKCCNLSNHISWHILSRRETPYLIYIYTYMYIYIYIQRERYNYIVYELYSHVQCFEIDLFDVSPKLVSSEEYYISNNCLFYSMTHTRTWFFKLGYWIRWLNETFKRYG